MNILCEHCNSFFLTEFDAAPPDGIEVPCPHCHKTVAIPGAKGPSSAEQPVLYVRRKSGKVFGPLPMSSVIHMIQNQTLRGDDELSRNNRTWMPLDEMPELARMLKGNESFGEEVITPVPLDMLGSHEGESYEELTPSESLPPGFIEADRSPVGRRRRSHGQDLGAWDPVPSISLDDIEGEPIPEAQSVDDIEEGMGLLRPSAGKPAKAGSRGEILDLLQPKPDSTDLLRPKADLTDLLRPKDEITDLPQPRGGLVDLPQPRGGLVDLPQPRGGLVDLPQPKEGITGLLEPKGGISGLPEPKGGISDFPEPKGGISGLPEPKGGISDFPEPKGGISGLPEPKGGISGLPEPKGGISDFPEPKGGISDFPEPKGGLSDFPEPKGLEGFFQYRETNIEDSGSFSDLDDMPVSPGSSIAADDDISLPDLSLPMASPTGGDGLAIDREFKEEGRSDGVVRFEAPLSDGSLAESELDLPGAEPKPAAGAEKAPAKPKAPRTKKDLLRMGGLCLGGLALLGIALGLFTDYGFFGARWLSGTVDKERKARAQMQEIRLGLGRDTYATYKRAATDFEELGKILSEDPDPMALQVQSLTALLLRFGPNKELRDRATGILSGLRQAEADSVEVEKATGLMLTVMGKTDQALVHLKGALGSRSDDPLVPVYLGWAYLQANKPKDALASFTSALKLDASLASAHFGMAQGHLALKHKKQALLALDQTLKANPRHASAMLLKATLLSEARKPKDSIALLEGVTRLAQDASLSERTSALCTLGELAVQAGTSDKARARFQEVVALDPRHVTALLGLGKLLFEAKQYSQALEKFEQARGAEPQNIDVAFMIARTLLATGKPLDALKALLAADVKAKERAELPFLLGQVYEEKNELKDAEAYYQQSIKLDSKYFNAYDRLSRIYLKQGDSRKALTVLEAARKTLPNNARVHNALGEIHLATRQWKKALAEFETALKLDKTLNIAVFNLGSALFAEGKLDLAKGHFLSLQKRDSQFPGLSAQLAALYAAQNDYLASAAEYDKALKADRPSVELRLKASRVFCLAKAYDKALDQAEQSLREDTSLSEARAIRAEALLAQEKFGDALVEIQSALSREPKAPYYVVLGRIYLALKRELDAIDAFNSALKSDPSLVEIQAQRAILLVKNGTVRDGLAQLEKVVRLLPDRGDLHLFMGVALYDLGEETRALNAFSQAVERSPKLGEAHFRVGQIQYDRGNLSQVIVSMNRAVKCPDASPEARWLPEAYFILGMAASKQGQRKQAVEAFQGFLKVAPLQSAMRPEAIKRLQEMGAPIGPDDLP